MNKLVCSTVSLFAFFFVAVAAHSVDQTLSQDENNEPLPVFSDGKVLLFPDNDPYPFYIADPYRPTNALNFQLNTVTDITDSSGTRTWLAAGGRFGVLRITPAEPRGRLWQISIEAGLDAQYDSGNNMDNIGYDGNYGLILTTVKSKNPSLLFGYRHVSGHVGDEWLKNNGRERIGYRRDELSIGTTFHVVGLWRYYGETGYGFYRLNQELQRPWRFQTGIQRESPRSLAKNRLGWYAAADIQLHQERDWQPDFSVETGLLVNSADRRWRIGVRFVAGQPPLTEFFQDNEQWLTVGLWMDF